MKLKLVKMWVCQACLDGDGDECHTPGCSLFLHVVGILTGWATGYSYLRYQSYRAEQAIAAFMENLQKLPSQ